MAKTLPARFDPDLVVRDGTRFEVVMPFRQFPRLLELLASDEGDVHASATFSRRKDHIVVAGRLRVSWPLECQRCLESMQVDVNEPYELVFVDSDEEAGALPDVLDPVVLDDNGQIRLIDLFEDELILHVPNIPRHDVDSDCARLARERGVIDAAALERDDASADPSADPSKRNPFEVLKDLKIH